MYTYLYIPYAYIYIYIPYAYIYIYIYINTAKKLPTATVLGSTIHF